MIKRLAFIATLLAMAAIPATATAEKLPDVVSIKADQYFCCTEEIFGSVESPAAKCERNRTIILFHNPSSEEGKRGFKRGVGFNVFATTTTDSKGEYLFDEGDVDNKLVPSSDFPPGDYFARVRRARRGGDVCRRDDSRVITLEGFIVCESEQAASDDAVQRKGPC